jgi:hypothetical protein
MVVLAYFNMERWYAYSSLTCKWLFSRITATLTHFGVLGPLLPSLSVSDEFLILRGENEMSLWQLDKITYSVRHGVC